MDETELEVQTQIETPDLSRGSAGIEGPLAQIGEAVGHTGARWRALRPVLVRTTAHVSVVIVAVVALVLGGLEPVGRLFGAETLQSANEADVTPQPPAPPTSPSSGGWRSTPPPALNRRAEPHTIIPERPRTSVFTYTVQSGDTVFGIAERFGLSPHTIYWANSEALHDNPHMLWPDIVLNILPVDGVYHTVSEGETVASIASDYGVSTDAIYNEWNDVEEGEELQAGSKLVIPGGSREFVVWQLPQYSEVSGSSSIGSGLCVMPSVGLRGNGWFHWPTDGRRISGWVFHDPRNPPHGGIDIGVRTGDPIYAADNGVVAYAGWNDWGYGYLVVLDHGNGFHTYYAHLSAIWVVCGQSVYQGAAIGAGGSTGRSSGPHLHFEIRYDGVPQNPASYLP